MNIYLGVVSKVTDDLKFIIEFTVEGLIENCIAYPIDTFDQPEVGDPIVLYEIESVFGFSFMYKKQRLFDHTRMKLNKSLVDIFDDHIEIHAGETESVITVNDDGSIKLTSTNKVVIESQLTEIVNATPTAAIPSISGNLNCITKCPLLGIDHGLSKNLKI